MAEISEALECSEPTAKRIIRGLRDHLHAPLEYDRDQNGYYYAGENRFELPGLWFNSGELHAMLTLQQLLSQFGPGLLAEELQPLMARMETMLGGERGQVGQRLRILAHASRILDRAMFSRVATATIQRQQITIEYHARSSDQSESRVVSPQRLTHYRDNWYLDAWCHKRQALRSFALDRITEAQVETEACMEVESGEIDAHFSSAYGIFSGPAPNMAVLRFSSKSSRWVAEEQWHAHQQGKWLEDGSYELSLPYGSPHELIMDILKHGPEVKVIAPSELREAVKAKLKASLENYI